MKFIPFLQDYIYNLSCLLDIFKSDDTSENAFFNARKHYKRVQVASRYIPYYMTKHLWADHLASYVKPITTVQFVNVFIIPDDLHTFMGLSIVATFEKRWGRLPE